MQLTGWTSEVTLFTNGELELPEEARRQLRAVGVQIREAPVARLVGNGQRLDAIELTGGARVPCEVLFAHPPQRQTALVEALGHVLDEAGFVEVHPMTRETSIPGVYAAGDLATHMQAAIAAAATGMQAGAAINGELMMERSITTFFGE